MTWRWLPSGRIFLAYRRASMYEVDAAAHSRFKLAVTDLLLIMFYARLDVPLPLPLQFAAIERDGYDEVLCVEQQPIAGLWCGERAHRERVAALLRG